MAIKKSNNVEVSLTETIQNLIESIERLTLDDARKFDDGNNAAGKRVRAAFKEINVPAKLKAIKAISLRK